MEICGEDHRRMISMLSDIGLEMNLLKSDVSGVSCDNFQSILIALESALSGVTVTEREDLITLGAPIDINGCRTGVIKAEVRHSTISSRLKSIDAHPAFFLLRNCLSISRLLFKLRSSPCNRLHSELIQFDETSGFHCLQHQFRRYRVTTVNTPRRTRWTLPLLLQ